MEMIKSFLLELVQETTMLWHPVYLRQIDGIRKAKYFQYFLVLSSAFKNWVIKNASSS